MKQLIAVWQKKIKGKMLLLLVVAVILVFIGDITLYFIDKVYGKEEGVVFGYELKDLLWQSNLAIGACFILFCLLAVAAKYSSIIKRIVLRAMIYVISILVLVLLVEAIFYFIIHYSGTQYASPYEYNENIFKRDSILGYALLENASGKYTKVLIDPTIQDTVPIFNTTIRTDNLGNRAIDIPGMRNRNKYALFFGCSFTFGLGVEDSQTIPYYFATYDSSFCAYNFGVTGYGTQSMLAQLEFKNIRNLVSQDSGVCFYIYMNAHPQRVIGDMKTYTSYGHDLPYYDYKNDSIHYYGLFKIDRPFTSSFYTIISKSNFVKYFNVNLPPKVSGSHYKLTCDIIQKARIEYQKQFNNDNFYVVIYPWSQDIIEYLKEYRIKVLDLSTLFKEHDIEQYFIKHDGHPTADAHEVVSKHLIRYIHNQIDSTITLHASN